VKNKNERQTMSYRWWQTLSNLDFVAKWNVLAVVGRSFFLPAYEFIQGQQHGHIASKMPNRVRTWRIELQELADSMHLFGSANKPNGQDTEKLAIWTEHTAVGARVKHLLSTSQATEESAFEVACQQVRAVVQTMCKDAIIKLIGTLGFWGHSPHSLAELLEGGARLNVIAGRILETEQPHRNIHDEVERLEEQMRQAKQRTNPDGSPAQEYQVGQKVRYTPTGETVEVLKVHTDDPSEVYYTVRMKNGFERGTVPGKLSSKGSEHTQPGPSCLEDLSLRLSRAKERKHNGVPVWVWKQLESLANNLGTNTGKIADLPELHKWLECTYLVICIHNVDPERAFSIVHRKLGNAPATLVKCLSAWLRNSVNPLMATPQLYDKHAKEARQVVKAEKQRGKKRAMDPADDRIGIKNATLRKQERLADKYRNITPIKLTEHMVALQEGTNRKERRKAQAKRKLSEDQGDSSLSDAEVEDDDGQRTWSTPLPDPDPSAQENTTDFNGLDGSEELGECDECRESFKAIDLHIIEDAAMCIECYTQQTSSEGALGQVTGFQELLQGGGKANQSGCYKCQDNSHEAGLSMTPSNDLICLDCKDRLGDGHAPLSSPEEDLLVGLIRSHPEPSKIATIKHKHKIGDFVYQIWHRPKHTNGNECEESGYFVLQVNPGCGVLTEGATG
jgi:hypothetical protein